MCTCWFPISRQCHLVQLGLPVALCSASPPCCHQIASPACSGLWERTRSLGAAFLGDIVDQRVFLWTALPKSIPLQAPVLHGYIFMSQSQTSLLSCLPKAVPCHPTPTLFLRHPHRHRKYQGALAMPHPIPVPACRISGP